MWEGPRSNPGPYPDLFVAILVVRRLPCRSDLQGLRDGWIRRPQQFEEFRFTDSPCSPLQSISLRIGNDRDWRAADVVASQQSRVVMVIHVNCHGDEVCIDRCRHLIIGPYFAFHDPAGNTPLAGEVEDDRFAGVSCLLLGRSVIVSPSDAIGRDVEAVPGVGKGRNEEYQPEASPEMEQLLSVRR